MVVPEPVVMRDPVLRRTEPGGDEAIASLAQEVARKSYLRK
jgi:hypothetical protein